MKKVKFSDKSIIYECYLVEVGHESLEKISEMERWCQQHCEASYGRLFDNWAFHLKSDAVLFMLRWL